MIATSVVQRSKRRRCDVLGLALTLAWLTSAAAPAAATPVLFLDIGGEGMNAVLSPGETVTVQAFASSIPPGSDGKGLFGFGFAIGFSALGLSAATPTAGASWTGITSSSSSAGGVTLTSNRLGESSGPSGDDILLGSFQLTALLPGFYVLDVTYLTGPGDNVLFDGTFLDASADFFSDASASVVPEPGTLGLLTLGALGFAVLRRLEIPRG
jgi:hypothetical protein